MTSRLYVRKGGDIGAGDIELTGFTGRKGIPFFDDDTALIKMGMRCENGEASQGTFKLMDPEAELPRTDFEFNLPAHTLVTWTEDAPGAEIWLARGRIAQYEGGRGDVVVDNQVEFDGLVDDGNMELRGQAFTEAWVRPAESDFDRIAALRAYTINGSGSTATNHRDTASVTVSNTHLCPNANLASMPAKTYPVGTQPQDVITDCADTAGKIYGVVIHHTGGSHLCLLYILETNHTTFATAAKISDNLADWNPTHATTPVYEPHWEAGKASIYDGNPLLSGLVSIYGTDKSVFVSNANATPYDYWVDSYYDSVSATPTQAATKASGLLLYRSLTHVTHRVSIIMLASQLDLIGAGMSIQIKSAAAMGGQYLDTYQTRRIAECQFEPRYDGTYWAHLALDRTPHTPKGGKVQPAATIPKPAPVPVADTTIRFYRMGDAGGQDFAWPDFAQFQGGGANGSTYCAFVSGSAWESQFSHAAVAGATYRVAGYCKVGTRFPLFCFYDIGPYTPTSIGDDTLIDARLSTTTLYSSVTGDVWTPFSSDIVAPTGTLSMGMAISGSGGLVLDEITVTLLGESDSDPFALADSGDSPYFTRSDDPRIVVATTADYLVGTTQAGLSAEIVVGTTPGGELGGTWAAPTVDATHAGSTHPPTAADYLVGTTQAGLSAEIVVGTTPGGELGGTWASPTVDATHSGSTHSAASDTHVADTTAAHVASSIGFTPNGSIAATDVQAAIQEVRDEAAGGGAHAASHEDGGADEIDVTGLVGAGSPADILDIPTAETDDTLVLAPDGAGGVEFRAETGGSGGNVSTLPAGAITLGSLALGDRVPASPGTYDEEFEGTADTLPSDWAWTSAPSGSDAWFLNSRWPSLLTVEGTGNTTYTLTRTSFTAAATFGIWAKVYLAPFTGADAADLRFYISNSGATEQRAMNFRGTASRASGVRGLRVIASVESGWGTELALGGSNGPVYFGMTRDGSNNFVGWFSKDGVTWDNLSGSQSHTITLDRIRVTLKTNTLRALAGLDWIRYRTDNEFPRP